MIVVHQSQLGGRTLKREGRTSSGRRGAGRKKYWKGGEKVLEGREGISTGKERKEASSETERKRRQYWAGEEERSKGKKKEEEGKRRWMRRMEGRRESWKTDGGGMPALTTPTSGAQQLLVSGTTYVASVCEQAGCHCV